MAELSQPLTDTPTKFIKFSGRAISAVGLILFALYLIYLPFPQLFEFGLVTDVGMVLYSLASAGAAMVAWGNIMAALNGASVKKNVVLKASALGFLLMGLMRIGTAAFPHSPFEQMIIVAITEALVFIAIAIKLYRMS